MTTPYIKGLSEPLSRCLKQHGARSVFKSDTTLISHFAWYNLIHTDPVDP